MRGGGERTVDGGSRELEERGDDGHHNPQHEGVPSRPVRSARLGVLASLWSLLLAVEMVFTTLVVKLDVGLIAPRGGGAGAELDLLFFAAFAAIALLGSDRWSLDRALSQRPAAAR